MGKQSSRAKHIEANKKLGSLFRFWYSKSAAEQQTLFPTDKIRFVRMGQELKMFNIMSTIQPDDPHYENDPYPQYKDKKFLGFYPIYAICWLKKKKRK